MQYTFKTWWQYVVVLLIVAGMVLHLTGVFLNSYSFGYSGLVGFLLPPDYEVY